MIEKWQIKRVYALASVAGLLERGNHDDDLHALVYAHTGKSSVSELTLLEYGVVVSALTAATRGLSQLARRDAAPRSKARDNAPAVPGMASKGQQALVWRFIYRLRELDGHTGAAPIDRLLGAIKKILGTDAPPSEPFRWVTAAGAETLIEQLKRYVRSAERSAGAAAKGGANDTTGGHRD
jgi:hypothetical protein